MIPQIKRILYATDLSDNSAYVFGYAINSAKNHDAGIIILHVLEPWSATTKALAYSYFTEEQEKKRSEEKIANVKERIRKELNTFCERELKNDPDSADMKVPYTSLIGPKAAPRIFPLSSKKPKSARRQPRSRPAPSSAALLTTRCWPWPTRWWLP